MPRATSHLNAVRAFEAAARHESFAKAAVELCVSHSVISRHIRNLEQWLGTDLFVRSGNRVELTENARLIAPKVTAAFLSVNDCFESLRKARSERSITIRAEPAIATRWLRRRLSIFRDEFPDIEIDLRASRRAPDVTDGTTDVAIHFESQFQSNDPSLQRLFPIDAYPACSPAYLREHSEGNSAVDIRDLSLVHDVGVHTWRDWFAKYDPQCTAWQNGRIYTDLALTIDAAVDGEGVILADDILCAKEFETGALIKLDDRILRCAWYCAAHGEAAFSDPTLGIFLAWLRKQAS